MVKFKVRSTVLRGGTFSKWDEEKECSGGKRDPVRERTLIFRRNRESNFEKAEKFNYLGTDITD